MAAGAGVDILVRPEALRLESGAPAGVNAFRGVVARCRYLGNVTHVFVRAPWDQVVLIEVAGHAPPAQAGETVTVAWEEDNAVAAGPHERRGRNAPSRRAGACCSNSR
jgi:ABC-type Fe3+/spermidine/putrescine transport system ATPase subunit